MNKSVIKSGCLTLLFILCRGYANEQPDISVPQKAYQLRLEGKSQQAKEMLSTYLELHPDDAVAHYEFSRTIGYLMDFETAEKQATLAAEKQPANAKYYSWQGKCAAYLFIDQAHHKGNLDPAILARSIAAYEKAVELNPDFYEARFELFCLLYESESEQGGDKEKARKHADYLIEKSPAYGLQAKLQINHGKSNEWKTQQYQEAIAKAPANAALYAGMAKLCAQSGDSDAMKKHLDKAIELDKSQKHALLEVVLPLAMKNDHPTAKQMTQRYLVLSTDEPAAMRAFATFYLAKIEKITGDSNADQTLQQARGIDPDVWMTMVPPPSEMFDPL